MSWFACGPARATMDELEHRIVGGGAHDRPAIASPHMPADLFSAHTQRVGDRTEHPLHLQRLGQHMHADP